MLLLPFFPLKNHMSSAHAVDWSESSSQNWKNFLSDPFSERQYPACLVRLERLVEGRQMPGHQREEDLLFMIEMPVERAFREAGLARNLLGRHACQSLQEKQLFRRIQDLLSRCSRHV